MKATPPLAPTLLMPLVITIFLGAARAGTQDDPPTAATVEAESAAEVEMVSAQENLAATTSPPPLPETRIGVIRADTLFVDLGEVIAVALERNEMLAASDATRAAADAEAQAAWGGILPRVSLGGFFLRSDDALNAFGFKLNQRRVTPAEFAPEQLNYPGETNNWVTQVRLLQPIFNGGMGWNGKAAADAASRAQAYQYRRDRETVVFQAVQVVEGLALAKAYEAVVLATREAARQHARQAESLMAADMATAADMLQAQVFLAGVETRLIEIRNMVAVAGENIELLTAVDTALPISTDLSLEERFGHTLPDWSAAVTVTGRADLRAHDERLHAAGKMEAVALGAMLPHVNFSIERNWFGRDALFGNDARSWSMGVYGTWDIFTGLENISHLKKARAERRAAEHMASFASRRARVEAREAYLTAEAAREKVDVARQAVNSAREGLRIVQNQYREGLTSMVELLDTQLAATQAETGLVEAQHDYVVGLARLRFAGIGPSLDPAADQEH